MRTPAARLKDLCEDAGQYGLNVPASEYAPGGVRMLRTTDLSPNGQLRDDVDPVFVSSPPSTRFLLREGDLLLTRSGSVGRSFLVRALSDPTTFAGFLIRFRPRPSTDPRFLAYVAESAPFQDAVQADAISSTIQNFNAQRYANIQVPNPPLDEQRRIADFLDASTERHDRLITAEETLLRLLQELEAGVVRHGVSGALGDLSATVAPPVPWLGPLHAEAIVMPLGRVLALQRGVDLTDDERKPGDVLVVTTAGVNGTHDRAVAKGPGVVIGRYGTVGAVHWVEGSYWPHNTTLYVKDFKGNDPRYCYFLLKSFPFEMQQARAAVPGVNRNNLHRELVAILPGPLQRLAVARIERRLEKISTARARAGRMIDLMTERRQTLITAAVTGRIDVTTARPTDP